MERPTKGCCGTCAWLAQSVISGGINEHPQWAVYDETDGSYRERPGEDFSFYPLGYNAQKQGRLVCFRRAANLPKEALDLGQNTGALGNATWTAVLWLDRKCPTWLQYEPGVAPRDQLAENRSRRFTIDLKKIETRLTVIAICVSAFIGLLQLSLMTPDSFGGLLCKKVDLCKQFLTEWYHEVPPQVPPGEPPRSR
jgi:hypothetical protein